MKNIERRNFIGSAIGLFSILNLGIYDIGHLSVRNKKPQKSSKNIKLKGKSGSRVTHWDIITIGNLSRNRYWGESDDKTLRSAICTCTVISGDDFHAIVDPSIEDRAAMAAELKRRTGLMPDDIDTVFLTHQHGDHVAGVSHFLKARWFAGSETAAGLNKSGRYQKEIEAAGKKLLGAIDVIPTPGHTPDHHSLRFDFRDLSVVIAGDSVATHDFWDERQMYYNVMDLEASKLSFDLIDSLADIIVPGHDNCFFNL